MYFCTVILHFSIAQNNNLKIIINVIVSCNDYMIQYNSAIPFFFSSRAQNGAGNSANFAPDNTISSLSRREAGSSSENDDRPDTVSGPCIPLVARTISANEDKTYSIPRHQHFRSEMSFAPFAADSS